LSKTLNYEYEKKSLADSLENAEQRHLDQLIFESKEEKQKLFTLSAILVGALLLVLLLITYKNFRKNKTINQQLTLQNKIITDQNSEMEKKNSAIQLQKEIIEEKNREIVDSIQYAKRIQEAILPNEVLLTERFNDSFILFKPKDIVSGDFYWVENKGNSCYVSVVDCTGHGVPGAFISLIGYNLLNRTVNELNQKEPSDILSTMDSQLEDLLSKSSIVVKDGMDLSLCKFDVLKTKTKLSFSGAHNSIWIIRDVNKKAIGNTLMKSEDFILYELKANRQSIGGHTEKQEFTQENVDLEKGDILYLFSDGYADQFGGSKGKKFKYGQLRELIISISGKTMSEQKNILDNSIEKWRGKHDQVDDVCIIGIKI
jgi:serine phosphatase RsbU (regulator of sigma subunit)